MNSISKTLNHRKKLKNNLKIITEESSFIKAQRMDVPEGLYEKCPSCNRTVNMKSNIDNDYICKHCGNHFRMRAIDRIKYIVDEDTFVEKGLGYITLNPLFQDGYEEKIVKYKKETNLDDAYIYGYGQIFGQ